MIKTACLIAYLSILATVCTSLENQYWKGRFSRNNIQGRFSRDHIPQYWKGRFSRDEIPQYWKGRFSRDEIPSLNENEQDEEKRELAGPMQAREFHDNVYEPMNDQYWKGRFMRLRGGHKRQFSREMEGGQTNGMRDAVQDEGRELVPAEHQEGQESEEERDVLVPMGHQEDAETEEERNLQSKEAQEQEEEKRQEGGEEEEEERDVKNDDMQGRFARQGRFRKREETELDAAAKALDQGRFRREEN